MSVTLVARIEREYGFRIQAISKVAPSDEAAVWRAGAERPLLIHQSPPWRTGEELAWVHALVAQVAGTFPLAIAPLATTSGATFLEHGGSLITVYPFVGGAYLDREDAAQREAAARLLAELHRVLRGCEMPPRPQPGPRSPWSELGKQPMPPELEDRELEAWRAVGGPRRVDQRDDEDRLAALALWRIAEAQARTEPRLERADGRVARRPQDDPDPSKTGDRAPEEAAGQDVPVDRDADVSDLLVHGRPVSGEPEVLEDVDRVASALLARRRPGDGDRADHRLRLAAFEDQRVTDPRLLGDRPHELLVEAAALERA